MMEEPKIEKIHPLIRVYFYIQKGMDVVNYFRYLIAIIMALYLILKLDNVQWMIIMFVVSAPVLLVIGWFYVHKMAQILDWLAIQYATYWSRYSFTLQEKIIELLEKLNKK